MSDDIKSQILSLLKENRNKLFSILEISEKLKLSWATASKYVEILFAEGNLSMEDRGNVKLIKYGGAKDG